MKKNLFVKFFIIGILLLGIVLAGCNTNPNIFGSIKIENNAPTLSITSVTITSANSKDPVISKNDTINAGGNKVYTDIPAGKTYKVTVTNDLNASVTSTLFKLQEDQTVTLSYDVTTLVVKK